MSKRKVHHGAKHERVATSEKFANKTAKKPHDSFFKTAFKEPKRTAELLRFAAKRNKSLAEFIDAVDLSSLKPLPTEGTRIDLSCASDLSFCVRLKHQPTQTAELLVGVVLEHKSFPDNDVLYQLEKYFFELVRKVDAERPMVAIIVYNGQEKWVPEKIRLYSKYPEYFRKVGLPFRLETIDVGNELPHIDKEKLDPAVMLALVAMKYVFDADKYRETFDEAVQYILKQDSKKLRSLV